MSGEARKDRFRWKKGVVTLAVNYLISYFPWGAISQRFRIV